MSVRKSVVAGVKWTLLSYTVGRLLSLVSSVLLARLLTPADFGLMAMATVIISFVDLFSNLGTAAAIIQQRTLSRELISSLFWLNVAFGVAVTTVLFLLAPVLAGLYREPRLVEVMQCLALTLCVGGLRSVHQALLQRELAFDTLAKVEIVAGLVSLVGGVVLALLGFGVWSLVVQSVIWNVLMTALVWLFSRWRPQLVFQWGLIKTVARYSLNLTGFSVFNYFARNADKFIIGRYLGVQPLGNYDLAYRLLLYPINAISSVVGRVVFPAYAKIQDDNAQLRRTFLKIASAIALVSFPVMFGLMVVCDQFVLTFFGAKWAPMIKVIAVLAPLGALQSIGTTVGTIYQAKGRTDWLLWWGVAAGSLTVLSFIIGLPWGIEGVAMSYAAMSLALTYPSLAIPFRLIDLKVRDLCEALWRPFAASCIMVLATLCVRVIVPSAVGHASQLAILVTAGFLSYSAAIWWLGRGELQELRSLLRHRA
jgi:O-antigen/teichoic acid export membrane protein